jgi:hypothetical protein
MVRVLVGARALRAIDDLSAIDASLVRFTAWQAGPEVGTRL